ncbi:MAG TPA: DUF1643 domain-containing protein [Candidatus Obscuribacterales bacterium]
MLAQANLTRMTGRHIPGRDVLANSAANDASSRLIVEFSSHSELGIESCAVFDGRRRYRYSLTRVWDSALPATAFIMLNPSSADAHKNDPTIARCMTLARRLGFGSLEVVNLFGLRTKEPKMLIAHKNPIGSLNDQFIADAVARASRVIVAWGNWGTFRGRNHVVLSLIREFPLFSFGLTFKNQPRHPLFLRSDTSLKPFLIDDSM